MSKSTRAGLARKLLEETLAASETPKHVPDDTPIDSTNYKLAANDGVKKYVDLGMIVDAMFWRHITGLYEAEISRLEKGIQEMRDVVDEKDRLLDQRLAKRRSRLGGMNL